MKYKHLFLIFVVILSPVSVFAQGIVLGKDRIFFNKHNESANSWSSSFIMTDSGLVLEDDRDKVEDVWVQTGRVPVGLNSKCPTAISINLSLAGDLPKTIPTVFVRYGCDGTHWSTWNVFSKVGKPTQKCIEYRCAIALPRVAQNEYLFLKKKPNASNSPRIFSEKDWCARIAKNNHRFFDHEIPFIGYVQFRLEFSFIDTKIILKDLNLFTSWQEKDFRGKKEAWNFILEPIGISPPHDK